MFYIGVIGTASCSPEVFRLAEEVGREVARQGAVMLCGGRGGVMEAASRGASLEGGTVVIGILPGTDREEQNSYLTYSIVTGLNDARNAVIARSSHSVIAVCGGYGTLSEIGLALKAGVPVIGLNTWDIKSPQGEKIIQETDQPDKAVTMALQLSRQVRGEG